MTRLLPPPDLHAREPLIVKVASGDVMHRFYSEENTPIYFDDSDRGRFNSLRGSFGVLYTSQTPLGAFAETFLRKPGRTLIDFDLLRRKAYVRLTATSELRFIQLAGNGLYRMGATAEVPHAPLPYDAPQAWAQALWSHPCQADGIAYNARHDDGERCYAIFNRCASAIEIIEQKAHLDADWFWRLAEHYDVGIAPDS